jgi:ABC-type glycerol-3-phosphate transport system substrate-binding protein
MSRRFRACISLCILGALLAPTQALRAQPARADTLSGTININIAGNNQDVWQKLAADYEALHPNVKVVVDLKPNDSHYADYISAGFAAGTPSFDLVYNNQNASLINAGKFLDFAPYLNQVDPYIGGKPWKDAIDLRDMLATNGSSNHIYDLNLETVQVLWFYNKGIFQKAGIATPPTTWSQLLADCAALKKAGYVPLALAGDYNSLWAANGGWLFRMYADQYTRSTINDERSQPGDYTYDPTIDAKWHYNPADPYNDDNDKVTINPLRRLIAIKKSFSDTPAQAKIDRWRNDSLPIQAVDQNLHDLLSNYTPSGWYGINQNTAYSLFLQQKAGILLDGGWRLSSFEKDLKDLKVTGTKSALQAFSLGTFNNPSMTGPNVQAPARTIEVAIDFYGVPKKSFAQNKLNVDFLMWFTSPQGYSKFMQYNVNSPDGTLTGPPIVKNVQLPSSLAARYKSITFIGNTEKGGTSGVGARGFDDYQPSVRSWVNLMQEYLANKITTQQFAAQEQQNVQSNFEAVLKFEGYRDSDLLTPQKQPPTRTQ